MTSPNTRRWSMAPASWLLPCKPVPEPTNHARQLLNAGRWRTHASANRAILQYTAQAHPPAAGGHPFPAFWQHHAFLATDHPAIQFANPALQSYGAEVVPTGAHPPAC